jgi:hypothetical protein
VRAPTGLYPLAAVRESSARVWPGRRLFVPGALVSQEKPIHKALQARTGIRKAASMVGVGTGTVQRIKREIAADIQLPEAVVRNTIGAPMPEAIVRNTSRLTFDVCITRSASGVQRSR